MEQENEKKIRSYALTALFGGILQIIFGFGFGFVNLAILLVTLAAALAALIKNKEQIKNVKLFSCIGLGLVIIAFILNSILGLKAPINIILNSLIK